MRYLIHAALLAASATAWASDSPVGLWKNVDDKTGKPKAMIRISEAEGVYQGKIEKVLRPADQDQNPKCEACEGADKGQPMVGLTIIKGLRKDGEEYANGTIMDPESGKTYRTKMKLADDGKKLEVRAYIGTPMLGRTQTWLRQE
jgi:uncharacterized protein (DUF2147 family)